MLQEISEGRIIAIDQEVHLTEGITRLCNTNERNVGKYNPFAASLNSYIDGLCTLVHDLIHKLVSCVDSGVFNL